MADEHLDMIQALVPSVRSRRRPLEEGWLYCHAAYRGVPTRQFYLGGTSNHYVPAARREVERAVTRSVRQVMPSQEWFEIYPWAEADVEQGREAENMRAYLLYDLIKYVGARKWVTNMFRTHYLYGRAITKTTILVTPTGDVWPTTRAVDPFAFFTWPETADHRDDVQCIFEDAMYPWVEYARLAKNGICKALDPNDVTTPQCPTYWTSRLQSMGFTDPTTTGAPGPKPNSGALFVALSEVWLKTVDGWRQTWVAWNVKGGPKIVRDQASPYGEHPYRWTAARSLPGEAYGSGMMADLEPLQCWLNDTINLTQDGLFVAMSPPVVIDPSELGRDDFTWRPRARWSADPNAVKMLSVPDTSKAGGAGIQMVLGFFQQFSGTNSLSEGQPPRGLPRSGFAVSSLISLAMADLTAVCEAMEDEVLTPALSDLARLGMQFTPEHQRMNIPSVMGLPPRTVNMRELYGDWTYRWVGSAQSQDMQVKSQRMLTLAGLLAKAAPTLATSGLTVDWVTYFTRLWRESMGERGAETILRKMTPQEMLLKLVTEQGLPGLQQIAGVGGPPPAMGGAGPPGGQPGGPQAGAAKAVGPGPTVPGTAANPATAEQAERASARSMQEGAIGQSLAMMGQG